jgi:hypothetical protein
MYDGFDDTDIYSISKGQEPTLFVHHIFLENREDGWIQSLLFMSSHVHC